ncbi:MAG: hypothetical protein IKP17_02395 [Oscillospiraceae bacterium]|nr:hypothetical protein [Oscillospiraceae bacterium]MBR4691589.1 hypothetical protein [Oscillospiraceae bacterium]
MLLSLLLNLPVRAADAEEVLADTLSLDGLSEAAEGSGAEDWGSPAEGVDAEGFLAALGRDALRALLEPELLRDMGAVLLTVLLCSAAGVVSDAAAAGFDAVSLAGAAAVTLLLAGGNDALVRETEETVYSLRDVSEVLLPILSSAALLSGQITAAAAKYAAAALFLNLLVRLCCGFVLPLVRLYVAAAAAEAAVGSGVMTSVLGFLRWCAVTALTVLMLAFTLYLSLTALTANSADAALVRSAKTAVSTLLPVVGGIAGDAAASLLSAAGVIRQSVGAFGLLTVTGFLAAPFLRAGLRGLLLKGVSAAAAGFASDRLSVLLKRLSEAMSLLLGCLGACGLLLFFTVYALMEASPV